MIFKVAVDTVIRHWVMVVAVIKLGVEGLSALVQYLAAYFYMYGRLVAFTQPERLQKAFNFLTHIFNQVGLWTNTQNMVSMSCHPCHAPVRMSVVVYGRRVTGMELDYWERQRMQVQCP